MCVHSGAVDFFLILHRKTQHEMASADADDGAGAAAAQQVLQSPELVRHICQFIRGPAAIARASGINRLWRQTMLQVVHCAFFDFGFNAQRRERKHLLRGRPSPRGIAAAQLLTFLFWLQTE